MTTKTRKAIKLYDGDANFEIRVNKADGNVGFYYGGTLVQSLNATEVVNAVAQAFANTALKVRDSAGDHEVSLVPAGDEAADRVLSIPLLGGADTLMTLALAQTIAGIKTFGAMFKIPVNAPVAGAGTVIGDAAALSTGITVITGANGTVGWILPVTTGGDIVILKGTTAGVAKLWPQTGGQINAVGTSTAMSLASGVIPVILISISATQWYTFPLLPS